MDPLRDPLDGLSPSLYVATLSEIAHVDGLHPDERELLSTRVAHGSADRSRGTAGWLSALADEMSAEEERYLRDLAERMALPAETIAAVSTWVGDYEALLERLDALISA